MYYPTHKLLTVLPQVSLLHTMLILAEDQITAHVQPLLLTLVHARTASAHKKTMTLAVDTCAAISGRYLPIDVALATLIPQLSHQPGAIPVMARSNFILYSLAIVGDDRTATLSTCHWASSKTQVNEGRCLRDGQQD